MALWGRMSLPPSLPAPRSHGKLRRSLKGTGVGSDVRFVADLRWKPAKYGTHTRPAYTHSLTYFRGSRVSGNSAAGWGWDCTGRRTDVSRSPDRRTQYHATRARPSLTAHHRQQSTRTPLTRTERLVRGLAEATRSPARTWCGLSDRNYSQKSLLLSSQDLHVLCASRTFVAHARCTAKNCLHGTAQRARPQRPLARRIHRKTRCSSWPSQLHHAPGS